MRKYFLIAVAAMAFAACTNDEGTSDGGEPVAARVTAAIVEEGQSRAIDQTWSAGDEIGIMATSVSGTTSGVTSQMTSLYKNVQYVVDAAGTGGTFSPAVEGGGIFFQDAIETVTFAAYYPYQSSGSDSQYSEGDSQANDGDDVLPGTNGIVAGGNTSEENVSTERQETIDFLYASGATASHSLPTISFSGDSEFRHKMARLVLTIQTGDGFDDGDIGKISKITMGGLIHEGTFNVIDGTATASGSVVDGWELRAGGEDKVVKSGDDKYTYTMILYPQELTSALTLDITVTDNDASVTYSNTSTIKPALEAGTSYAYTITMNKTGLEVSGCTIGEWSKGTSGGDGSVDL